MKEETLESIHEYMMPVYSGEMALVRIYLIHRHQAKIIEAMVPCQDGKINVERCLDEVKTRAEILLKDASNG